MARESGLGGSGFEPRGRGGVRPRGRAAIVMAVVALAVAAVGVWLLWTRPAGEEGAAGLAERVQVETPAADEEVASPLTVRGQAPGPWFFEASFSVRLLDGEGRRVAEAVAMTEADWMTEESVPFRATLSFDLPSTTDGTLVLERANPSGLPEHAAAVRVPVRFPATTTLRLFFPDSLRDSRTLDCTRVHPVERRVIARDDPARAALQALLAGPTPEERRRGVLTAVPEGATLREVSIRDGVAVADFDAGLERGVAGSCRVLAIRAQIERTLRALPGVREVVISVEGRTEEALQP